MHRKLAICMSQLYRILHQAEVPLACLRSSSSESSASPKALLKGLHHDGIAEDTDARMPQIGVNTAVKLRCPLRSIFKHLFVLL